MYATEIVAFSKKTNTIHIEWDGVNHYAALLTDHDGGTD